MLMEQIVSSTRGRMFGIAAVAALTFLYSVSSVHQLSASVNAEPRLITRDVDAGAISRITTEHGNNLMNEAPVAVHGGSQTKEHTSGSKAAAKSLPKVVPTKEVTPKAKAEPLPDTCGTVSPHTDSWGDALEGGFVVSDAAACCAKCNNYIPVNAHDLLECNVWVFCDDAKLCGDQYRHCWLKHLAHPEAVKPSGQGPKVGWMSGKKLSQSQLEPVHVDPNEDRHYHVVITAQGAAVHWQSRVGYYWYLKTKKACEAAGKCDMGGFTRVLHSGVADDLMTEIPSFVAQPLPPEHPDHGYVVLNRPYALLQWVQQVTIPEKYVLMSEPDHIWLKPMPNLMTGGRPAAFPFFYIEPWKQEYLPITSKFTGNLTRKEAEELAPIGNAPTMMSFEDMKKVMPIWFNVSIAVHNDQEAAKAWGWVQEMYAFTISCYKAGIRGISLFLDMAAQPPWDTKMDPYYILHYTYGNDYTKEGVFTPGKIGEWRFDKRSYGSKPPPKNGLTEPPPGMTNELVRHLIHAINEASVVIPGWDEYHQTGKATEFWDGQTFAEDAKTE